MTALEMQPPTESAECAICGAGDPAIVFIGRDRQHDVPGLFFLCQCRICGCFYLNPRPSCDALGLYYPDDYAPFTSMDQARESKLRQAEVYLGVRKQMKWALPRIPERGRALDVGCATGTFLVALRRRGWDVEGVELNARAAAYVRQQMKINVFQGDFAETSYPDEAFDLVTFWDVLEHLPAPRQALQEAARITRPSGALILSLPNPDSLEAHRFGRYWAGWDVPRHLWLASRSTLVRLLDESGWEARDFAYFRGRQWLLTLSLRFWLQDRHVPEWLSKGSLRLMRSLPAKALLWPYFTAIEQLALGSIIVIMARKKGKLGC